MTTIGSSQLTLGVAIFLVNENKEVLTQFRVDQRNKFSKGYEIPMGRVEQGENFVQAALREVQEETGIILEQNHLQEVYTGLVSLNEFQSVGCLFVASVQSHQLNKNHQETNFNHKWQWMPFDIFGSQVQIYEPLKLLIQNGFQNLQRIINHEFSIARGYAFIERSLKDNGPLSQLSYKENEPHVLKKESPDNFSPAFLSLVLPRYEKQFHHKYFKYIEEESQEGKYCFFKTKEYVPLDWDTTSIVQTANMKIGIADQKILQNLGVEMTQQFLDEQGIIRTYICHNRYRPPDFVVVANAIQLLYATELQNKALGSIRYLQNTLKSRAYLGESRYYLSPVHLLYCVHKTSQFFSKAEDDYGQLLDKEVSWYLSNFNQTSGINYLDLSMMTIMGRERLGRDMNEYQKLILGGQDKTTGGWPLEGFIRYYAQRRNIGSSETTTAFAIRALSKTFVKRLI